MGAELEYQLGILCEEELGRFEDALVHYQTAFKLRPDNLGAAAPWTRHLSVARRHGHGGAAHRAASRQPRR